MTDTIVIMTCMAVCNHRKVVATIILDSLCMCFNIMVALINFFLLKRVVETLQKID